MKRGKKRKTDVKDGKRDNIEEKGGNEEKREVKGIAGGIKEEREKRERGN